MLIATWASVATSLPRVGDERSGSETLADGSASVSRSFDVVTRAQKATRQEGYLSCRVRGIDGLGPDEKIRINAIIENRETGEISENAQEIGLADIPASGEEFEMPAVGISRALDCPPDGECTQSYTVRCERTDSFDAASVQLDWRYNAEMVYEAPLFSCETIDVSVEIVDP